MVQTVLNAYTLKRKHYKTDQEFFKAGANAMYRHGVLHVYTSTALQHKQILSAQPQPHYGTIYKIGQPEWGD